MRIRVLYFAGCRADCGTGEESVELPAGATVAALFCKVSRRHPKLALWRRSLRFAVNEQMTRPARRLRSGDVVALLPPLSGGSPLSDGRITRARIRPERLAAQVLSGARAAGALCLFAGVVRPSEKGRAIRAITYELYSSMAGRALAAVCRETRRRFPVRALRIVHRFGRIPAGQAAVAIAVATRRRDAAFKACRFAIERIKKEVPIWKTEYEPQRARRKKGRTQRKTNGRTA